MTHLLILLFYLFHYGRAREFDGAIPLVVRSPYLNCWGFNGEGVGTNETTRTPSIFSDCDSEDVSNDLGLDACYFLARYSTNIDRTLAA